MAANQVMLVTIFLATAALSQAKEFIVGDEKGWTINFNYSTWSEGKEFKVGDKLVFQYPVGNHNVYKVNGTDFKSCRVPLMEEAQPLSSGHDVITLATPGRKWYICGVGDGAHCSTGQKLFVNVEDASPSPGWWAPAPVPATWEVPAASPSPWEAPKTWAPSASWDTPAPVSRKIVAWLAPTSSPETWAPSSQDTPAPVFRKIVAWSAPTPSPETWAPSPSWDTPAPIPRKIVAWSAPTPSPSSDGY